MVVDGVSVAIVVGLINVMATVGGGFYFMGRMSGRFETYDVRMAHIETDVHYVKNTVATAAVDANRLTRAEADIHNLDIDLRNLRKGVGWINDRDAQGVNREYG